MVIVGSVSLAVAGSLFANDEDEARYPGPGPGIDWYHRKPIKSLTILLFDYGKTGQSHQRRVPGLGHTRGSLDTAILIRLDPDRDQVTTLSIPSDLQVSSRRSVTGDLGGAFASGGPALALQ